MRLGLLETGRPPEQLAHMGSYPSMMEKWLQIPDAQTTSYAVLDMEFPQSPDDADLWVITGSKFGAYEDHPWIEPLSAFIRDAHSNGSLMVGICFGHQIIAQALGGIVRKSNKGWGVGVHDYTTQDWPKELGPPPKNISFQVFHQDQVEVAPDQAKTIASNPFCENAAFWYPNFALTFQGHPEFGPEFVSGLIKSRGPELFSDEIAQTAQASVNNPTSSDEIASQIRNWYNAQQKVASS